MGDLQTVRSWTTGVRTEANSKTPRKLAPRNRAIRNLPNRKRRDREGCPHFPVSTQHSKIPLGNSLRPIWIQGNRHYVISTARRYAEMRGTSRGTTPKWVSWKQYAIAQRTHHHLGWTTRHGIAKRALDMLQSRHMAGKPRRLRTKMRGNTESIAKICIALGQITFHPRGRARPLIGWSIFHRRIAR